jgi:DNA-binding transcriptional LysR family regulator
MDPLTDIAVFVEVVDRGSFTGAAHSLELSKGAVSKYVTRLEQRLGARLLQRTTRRLTLTEAGSALYDGAARALEQISTVEDTVMGLSGAPRGKLRVTAPVYFGSTFLVPTIEQFLARYPDIQLELDLDNRIVDLVEERYDVAIRITTLASSSLVARRFASSGLVTVASPRYLEAHDVPRVPQDLCEHNCLSYALELTPGEWQFRNAQGENIGVRVRGSLRCNSDEILKQAALDSVGIAHFPELFVTDELAAGKLVRILADYEPPPSSLCAVFPTRANLAPKVRVFVDFLDERIGKSQLRR